MTTRATTRYGSERRRTPDSGRETPREPLAIKPPRHRVCTPWVTSAQAGRNDPVFTGPSHNLLGGWHFRSLATRRDRLAAAHDRGGSNGRRERGPRRRAARHERCRPATSNQALPCTDTAVDTAGRETQPGLALGRPAATGQTGSQRWSCGDEQTRHRGKRVNAAGRGPAGSKPPVNRCRSGESPWETPPIWVLGDGPRVLAIDATVAIAGPVCSSGPSRGSGRAIPSMPQKMVVAVANSQPANIFLRSAGPPMIRRRLVHRRGDGPGRGHLTFNARGLYRGAGCTPTSFGHPFHLDGKRVWVAWTERFSLGIERPAGYVFPSSLFPGPQHRTTRGGSELRGLSSRQRRRGAR